MSVVCWFFFDKRVCQAEASWCKVSNLHLYCRLQRRRTNWRPRSNSERISRFSRSLKHSEFTFEPLTSWYYKYSQDRHSCTKGVYCNVDHSAHRGSHHWLENVPCWTVWTNAWPKVREIFRTPPPQLHKLAPLLHTCSPTFKPVEQEQESSKMYNGPGFLPCNGWTTSSALRYTPSP